MTIRFRLDPESPDERVLAVAGRVLRSGRLVAFPTETVYGLGANALSSEAVACIFAAKGRPADNPLIVHVASVEDVRQVARMDHRAEVLFRRFAPGPLTLVLPAREDVPENVRASLPTVAVRIPAHPVALGLLRYCGCPVAAPSANSSGRPSPTTAEAVAEDLGNSPAVLLDGGSTVLGVESTVVDAVSETLTLLRPGGLPLEELEAVAGKVLLPETAQLLAHSPGTRHRHYAPTLPLFLWEEEDQVWAEVAALARPGEIGYVGLREPPFECGVVRRFAHADAYAAGLFGALRDLEKCALRLLVADMPSSFRIGRALRDRLRRAAQRS